MIYLICLYIICGILNYGLLFGYFQNEFKDLAEERYKEDQIYGIILGLTGFFIVWLNTDFGKYGLKWR
ncbi:MAG: hypothetical protein WC516_06025 [Patescibacteria group bacterium]|jgi:hypothetical protein